jgi:acetone carboxylase gamma subunit
VLLKEGPVQSAGPWVDPHNIGRDRFVCREFSCPGCLTLLDVEIAQRDEPLLWDVRLRIVYFKRNALGGADDWRRVACRGR